ncbi:MAG: hypothetical protein NVV70_17235 [Cellulomonas sp.]|nr:hypothetical protein [Cellulomonas sp.]MCR6649791.1 hypothetical protein [Cellulomonas sp.]
MTIVSPASSATVSTPRSTEAQNGFPTSGTTSPISSERRLRS